MTQPRIEAVVFDLGGVLIDWDPRYVYRDVFGGDEAAMERFLADVCTPEWNARQDAGRSWADAVASLIALHPHLRAEISAYDERWAEMLGGPIAGSVAVARELHEAGMPLYALSNWSAEKFPLARARPEYAFLDWFGGLVISGEVGMLKPDPRIFRYLLDRFGLTAQTTAYVDDGAANVDAARALGMVAFGFDGPARLRADLRSIGLLDEPVPLAD